jgi:hypothetical protein
MKINYWFYADPNDGPTTEFLPVLFKQFPDAVLCTSFDQLCNNIKGDGKHAVLIFFPQSPVVSPEQARSIRRNEILELTGQGIECVLFVPELFDISGDFGWTTIPNLLIVAPGQHNFGRLNYPWVIWQHWLQDAVDVYQQTSMAEYIVTLDTVRPKTYLFDVLLGGLRPYRTLLHDWIEEDTVLSANSIMTYYGGTTTRPKIILEPDMDINGLPTLLHTGYGLEFRGVSTRMSVVPPVSIYQQCAYSIVTETNAEQNYVFFTEKIARAMVCQRLFVVLSSYNYLHYLRQAGFQTFGDIINESYDLEVNDTRRWRMAFEQMQALSAMDQQQVLERIKPIVEHNRRVLLETDWHKKMSQQVGQILHARLGLNLKPA